MTGFDKPNFTMTPNMLFDELMMDMSEAELKVVLTIIRQTFGYHKRNDAISLTQLQKTTGLSRTACQAGVEAVIKRGLVTRHVGKRNMNIFQLVVNDYQLEIATSTSSELLPMTSSKLLHTKEKVNKPKKEKNIAPTIRPYFEAIAKGAFDIADFKGISKGSRQRIGALEQIAKTLVASRFPAISDTEGALLVSKYCAAEKFKPNLQGKPKFELGLAAWLEKNAQHIPNFLASQAAKPAVLIEDDSTEYIDPELVKKVIQETAAKLSGNTLKVAS